MSLDVYLMETKPTEVYWSNITHNLTKMAEEAGIYMALWRPEEIGCKLARDLIPILEDGIKKLKSDPNRFKKHNPPNKWGSYDGLVRFASDYLLACKENPNATIEISR